jgi:hypothetical protein
MRPFDYDEHHATRIVGDAAELGIRTAPSGGQLESDCLTRDSIRSSAMILSPPQGRETFGNHPG